jgi:4-hydroxy-tetrahydrodipicolinate reductase
LKYNHKHKKRSSIRNSSDAWKGIAAGKKKDFYKLMGRKYLNKKTFPYSKKINFNSIRKGEIVGNHKVFFQLGKKLSL